MTQSRKHRAAKRATAALAVTLAMGACGGGDDTETDDAQEQTAESNTDTADSVEGEPATDEAAADDAPAAASDQEGAAGSIAWTAPDGMDAATIAVSPGGDQVAVGFQSTSATDAEVVVLDVASGNEAWRGSIDDVGDFGLGGLMFTTAGVSFYLTTLEGSQIVTFTGGDTSTIDVDFECAQFVSGTVHPTENVAYTVVPGGICRVDLSTGEFTAVTVGDLLPGSIGSNGSIAFAPDGSLVATVTNADGAPQGISVDPATLAAIEPVDELPSRLETEYRDLLVAGPSISSGDRIASSPDRSTIVLLQPDSLDVIG